MEEKDINGIAAAVTVAIGKLNSDTKEKEREQTGDPETFSCPECGSPVNGMTPYCPNCGCPLAWSD